MIFRENNGSTELLAQLMDILLMGVGFYLIIDLYEAKRVIVNADIPLNYFLIFLTYILFWLLSTNVYHVYTIRSFNSWPQEGGQLAKAHFMSFALSVTFLLFFDPKLINNRFVFYFAAAALVLTFGFHFLNRMFLETRRRTGRHTRYVLLLGSGPTAYGYLKRIKENPQLGYQVIGYLAPVRNGLDIPYLGDYAQLETVLRENIVDLAAVSANISDQGIRECLGLLEIMGKNVVIMLDDLVSKVMRGRPLDFGGLSLLAYESYPARPMHELAKRTLDFSLTALGLLVISPVLAVIALAIKITSKGPVFFSQDRVGLNGRIFRMYKFRSMVQDAEELKAKLAHLNEMSGPVFKIKDDPRVTKVGKFLRKTSLDELPQLWNVLKGDMSLVGPRPPLPGEVSLYDPKHRVRLAVQPGITCIWQISGRNDVDFEQWMGMDAEYVERRTFWLDIEILAKTVPAVLLKKGAS